MTPKRALVALLTAGALAASPVALAGCGKSGSDQAKSSSAAAAQIQSYVAAMAKLTAATTKQLADISGTADYQSASSAAKSTRAYATAIRATAAQLTKLVAPTAVATQHRQLIALYNATAARLDKLSNSFAAANDPAALAARAQDLSSEVQRYSTQEQQLRSGIERTLAAALGPAVAATN